jgi:hypothetical protein
VLVFAALLYLKDLGRAPVYLGWDEARTAVQGYSLATTGRDMNGHRAPLLFHITDPLIPNHSSRTWWQPTLFYLTAGVLLIAPMAEWSVRLPNVMLALLNVWVIYGIARHVFSSRWYGVLAAVMLTLTPIHFFFARLAQDYFLPQTFALIWLWCLVKYLPEDRTWLAAAAGLALGTGMYTHISAWITMPFFLGVSTLVFWVKAKGTRATLAIWAGFGVALLPLAVWFWHQPSLLRDMFQNYGIVTTLNVSERISLYWEYFNPSYLFFSGGTDPMWATRRAGVFLLPMAVLLPCGIWNIWRRGPAIPRVLLLLGFFFAPVPIVATLPEAPHYATARELVVGPFGVLVGVAGVEWLLAANRPIPRLIAAILVVSLPIQFASFAHDYFTDYQRRSSFRHDDLNVRAVAEFAIASDNAGRVPGIYLSDTLSAGKVVQWKFHLITHQRTDLWERTAYLSSATPLGHDIPSGGLLVLYANDARARELIDSGDFVMVHQVKDLTDGPTAAVLRRN